MTWKDNENSSIDDENEIFKINIEGSMAFQIIKKILSNIDFPHFIIIIIFLNAAFDYKNKFSIRANLSELYAFLSSCRQQLFYLLHLKTTARF